MTITLNNIGKKFNRDWIFRNVNLQFQSGNQYAILGPNGSGKSTFLQVIAGNLLASEGSIKYDSDITNEEIFRHISICAPYLQLIEELTLAELIGLHIKFKPLVDGLNVENTIKLLELNHVFDKQIRYYSSGMKQRVKLGLALLSDVSLIILDEPLTNLDDKGKQWYYELFQQYSTDKIMLVGSNRADEYQYCNHQTNILQYK
jgi:ABC-type multidrug transport system ATPase subunit